MGLLMTLCCAFVPESVARLTADRLTDFESSYSPDSTSIAYYSSILGIPVDTFSHLPLLAMSVDWLGTPYRRAGYSKSGIDCSGFVSKVYDEVYGIKLTHSSSSMIYQMKERVKKTALRQGDILFFKIRGSRISHVGIYLAGNKFIHASPSRGIVVDDLRQAYYQRTYYTAGRVY